MDSEARQQIEDGEYGDVAPLFTELERYFQESPFHRIVGYAYHGTDNGNQPGVGLLIQDETGKWRKVLIEDVYDWTRPGRVPSKEAVERNRANGI